ncbi:MAG: TetR/AcrR family transcriptional regulator [Spirochaetes bacterium]|nr:TetR/AcrR family transcriptional regulator [Spirochaetota bacterium]
MRNETVEKRRKEIFQAALKIFSQKGFDKATLDEIADKVKLSKPALYLYFKNKENLIISLVDEILKEYNETFESDIRACKKPFEKLRFIISNQIDFFKRNKEFFRITRNIHIESASKEKSHLHNKFMIMYTDYMEKIVSVIHECIKAKLLIEEDKYFLTFSLMGLINHNVIQCLWRFNGKFPRDLDKKILDLFLKGAGR